jgi:hypothetical protein
MRLSESSSEMKKRDIEKQLSKNGWWLARHGSGHGVGRKNQEK